MASVFTDYGEEWVQDLVINSGKTFTIGLYADADGPGTPASTDDITDSSDIGAITTEPAGSNYSAQDDAANNFTAGLDDSNNVSITGSTLTYDVSDSSADVNAYYITVTYASDLVGSDGGTSTEHLIGTAFLDQTYDLSQFDTTVDLDPAELTLS